MVPDTVAVEIAHANRAAGAGDADHFVEDLGGVLKIFKQKPRPAKIKLVVLSRYCSRVAETILDGSLVFMVQPTLIESALGSIHTYYASRRQHKISHHPRSGPGGTT